MKMLGKQFDFDPEVEALVSLEPYAVESYGSPPRWVLRASLAQTGTRLPKREPFVHKPIWQGDYDDSDWQPYGFTPIETVAKTRRERRKQRYEQKKAAKNVVPKGNLEESDYQFWRGSASTDYKASYCRWCDRGFYNKADRQRHFQKESDHSHRIQIVQAWAAATHLANCFACNKQTYAKRWGFPLCNSVTCLGIWKFAGQPHVVGWTEAKSEAQRSGILAQAGYP